MFTITHKKKKIISYWKYVYIIILIYLSNKYTKIENLWFFFFVLLHVLISTKSFVKSNDLRLKSYWDYVDIVTFNEICFNRINRTSFYSKCIHNNTKRVRENSYSYKTIYLQKENMYDLINTIRRNDSSKNYLFPFRHTIRDDIINKLFSFRCEMYDL